MPKTVDDVVQAGTMSAATQPTLSVDDELSLRPFADTDLDAVQRAFNDPDIVRWHGFRIDDVEQARAWIERNRQQWHDEKSAVWAVVDSSNQVLGRCAMYTDLARGTGEIAYWTLPEARGRSVAVRAALAVTDWAHHDLGLHRILLQHAVENSASRSVANRLGYIAEGIARHEALHEDGWHDMQQHAHLATDPLPRS